MGEVAICYLIQNLGIWGQGTQEVEYVALFFGVYIVPEFLEN